MPPPELPGDAPVAHVLHPVDVDRCVAVREELHLALLHHVDRRLGKLLHPAEPLLATAAARSRCGSARTCPRSACSPRSSRSGPALQGRRRPSLAPRSDPAPRSARRLPGSCEPSGPITTTCGRLCRRPISKSLGSCAGVTFTAPVPNSMSTNSSSTIGNHAVRQRQLHVLAEHAL